MPAPSMDARCLPGTFADQKRKLALASNGSPSKRFLTPDSLIDRRDGRNAHPSPAMRTMQRKPTCEVEVSTGCAIRAAGR